MLKVAGHQPVQRLHPKGSAIALRPGCGLPKIAYSNGCAIVASLSTMAVYVGHNQGYPGWRFAWQAELDWHVMPVRAGWVGRGHRSRWTVTPGSRVIPLGDSAGTIERVRHLRVMERNAYWVAPSPVEDDNESVLNLVRLGAVVVAIVLTACAEAPSTDTASQTSTSLAIQNENTTTTAGTEPRVMRRVGEQFILGDVQLSVLSVQDPFSSTAQMQPAAGHRLVSIRYEVVSQSSTDLTALPVVELRDSSGAAYQSEHGRMSVINGSRRPGELATGRRMESNAVFDIPASATGLRGGFRLPSSPETAVVTLD